MTTSLDDIRAQLDASISSTAPGLSAADALCAACVTLLEVDEAAVSVVLGGASSGTFGSSSVNSRRLDEHQFTFGEGPCLEAVATRTPVLVPDLDAADEQRWPLLRGALLDDGVRGVFALPILVTSVCVGALDLFRRRPGPMEGNALAGALLAAELASAPLLDLVGADAQGEQGAATSVDGDDGERAAGLDRVEVYQATGMLIAALDVDADEAVARLRAHAVATGQTASQVARAIIERRLVLDSDHGGSSRRPGDQGGAGRRSP